MRLKVQVEKINAASVDIAWFAGLNNHGIVTVQIAQSEFRCAVAELTAARFWGLKPNGTKTYYKDFLPMSMGALNAITMKIKMQYYKRSYWNILFRTKMKDARKNLIR